MIGLEGCPPRCLAGGGHSGRGRLSEGEEVRRVSSSDVVLLGGRVEEIARVLANRLEHAEARALRTHETLIDERAEAVEISAAHVLCRLERASPDEDGEATKERPLIVVQEVDTPADRVAQRPVPGRGVARSRK